MPICRHFQCGNINGTQCARESRSVTAARSGAARGLLPFRTAELADNAFADAAARPVRDRARDAASRVTVLVLPTQEPTQSGGCDTRSVLWTEVCRDLANEDLFKAS